MPLSARNHAVPAPGTPVGIVRATPEQRVMGTRTLPMRQVAYGEFMDKLNTARRGNHDYEVKGRDLRVNENGTITIPDGGIFSWNDFSFSQLAAKLKIPADFLRKSPVGDGPAGKKAIIDYWKEGHDDKAFFVRTKHVDQRDPETGAIGFVRAFLGNRYGVFDNTELADMMGHFVQRDRLVIQAGQITDKALHFRLLYPDGVDVGGDPAGKPDVHQVGLHIRNSEVGFCNFQVDFMLFRQICTNGMVALLDKEHLVDQKHNGIEHHQMRMLAQASLDTVQERYNEVLARVERTRLVEYDHPMRELHRVLKVNKIATEEVTLACEKAYEAEPHANKFGIIQAITRAAQLFPVHQRVKMEEVAGNLLMSGALAVGISFIEVPILPSCEPARVVRRKGVE